MRKFVKAEPLKPAIVIKGDEITINPSLMKIGYQYPITYKGEEYVAIRINKHSVILYEVVEGV